MVRVKISDNMLIDYIGEFALEPEDFTCLSSNSHYAYYYCIPWNTYFTRIDWNVNGKLHIDNKERHEQGLLKLPCSGSNNGTTVFCIARYPMTCLYSKEANLFVQGIVIEIIKFLVIM